MISVIPCGVTITNASSHFLTEHVALKMLNVENQTFAKVKKVTFARMQEIFHEDANGDAKEYKNTNKEFFIIVLDE